MDVSALAAAFGTTLTSLRQDPSKWIRWLPVQLRYMQSTSKARLLRAGNQSVGKTTGALCDLYWDATGEHPYRPCEAHGEYWIICASWSQSVAIQKKLHDLISPARMKPGTEFSEIRGFRGKNPAVEVRHEDGGYSVIRFKTTRQGTLNLASATIRGALFDEPPTSQGVYTEVQKRIQALGGWVSIAMTPVGAPVEWIREEAESGRLEDIHTRLTPEALIPVGCRNPLRLEDGTLCDGDWIRSIEEVTPEHERDVRVHGGWEIRSSERYFQPFASEGENGHVHARVPKGELTVLLGLDHGDRPGKQIGLLVLVAEAHSSDSWPRIYVLDEYVDDTGAATPKDDARGLIDMLGRHGMAWHSIDYAGGDRVHLPGSGAQKSNLDLMAQLGKLLKVSSRSLRPQIHTVKRGMANRRGAVTTGSRWLYQQMVRDGGFGVHPRCKRLIDALDNYTLRDDDYKDPVDALRYALNRHIYPQNGSTGATVRFRG